MVLVYCFIFILTSYVLSAEVEDNTKTNYFLWLSVFCILWGILAFLF